MNLHGAQEKREERASLRHIIRGNPNTSEASTDYTLLHGVKVPIHFSVCTVPANPEPTNQLRMRERSDRQHKLREVHTT